MSDNIVESEHWIVTRYIGPATAMPRIRYQILHRLLYGGEVIGNLTAEDLVELVNGLTTADKQTRGTAST
jgi:hypothetical protein